MSVTLFDHGAGNLHSLCRALEQSGVHVHVEPDPTRAAEATLLVLPGVGAFASAAQRMAPGLRLLRAALANGLPCMGICLGMQLLFEGSDEGPGEGLGVFHGRATRLAAKRVPQIGWNTLESARDAVFSQTPLDTAYFAHSYACRPDDTGDVIAWSTHEGDRFASAVRRGRVIGVQFHPEKSSAPGVEFLAACLRAVAG